MNKKSLTIVLIGSLDEVSKLLHDIHRDGLFLLNIKGISYNAEFLTFIEQFNPDLVLLKISKDFPVWECMEAIKTKNNQVEIMLISKERNFEYAYRAIQNHASNFLLEPVSKKILLQNLEEVEIKLNMAREIIRDRKKIDLYELRQHQVQMERIVTSMLEKPEELEFLLSEVNYRYEIELYNDNFFAVVVNVDQSELYFTKSGYVQKALNIIETSFPFAHEVISAMIMPYGMTGIINMSSMDYKKIEEAIQLFYQKLVSLKKEYGTFEIAIGVGPVVHSMKEINFSLQEAFRAEQYKLVNSEKKIFYASELTNRLNVPTTIMSASQKKRLTKILLNLDIECLELWFDEIISQTENSFKEYPEGYGHLKDSILMVIKEVWNSQHVEMLLKEEESNLLQMEYTFKGRNILDLLKKGIMNICSKYKNSQNTVITLPIQKGLDYLNIHYNTPISLEELADICDLSPNYFSSLFKEQIGLTYIDYLTEIRLTQAKKLLTTTNKTIKDITLEIGYLDDKYLRKLFKFRFGMVPSAYRNKMSSDILKN